MLVARLAHLVIGCVVNMVSTIDYCYKLKTKETIFFLNFLEYYYDWIEGEDAPMNSELKDANGKCNFFF